MGIKSKVKLLAEHHWPIYNSPLFNWLIYWPIYNKSIKNQNITIGIANLQIQTYCTQPVGHNLTLYARNILQIVKYSLYFVWFFYAIQYECWNSSSESPLAEVMVCCWWQQANTWTTMELLSLRFSDIHHKRHLIHQSLQLADILVMTWARISAMVMI